VPGAGSFAQVTPSWPPVPVAALALSTIRKMYRPSRKEDWTRVLPARKIGPDQTRTRSQDRPLIRYSSRAATGREDVNARAVRIGWRLLPRPRSGRVDGTGSIGGARHPLHAVDKNSESRRRHGRGDGSDAHRAANPEHRNRGRAGTTSSGLPSQADE
jgi:hypothetical protein